MNSQLIPTTRLRTQNPPTQLKAIIDNETSDAECNIDRVPNKARKAEVEVVLSNSYAFGGNNACLVLRKI